jgi:hypothetical protein
LRWRILQIAEESFLFGGMGVLESNGEPDHAGGGVVLDLDRLACGDLRRDVVREAL